MTEDENPGSANFPRIVEGNTSEEDYDRRSPKAKATMKGVWNRALSVTFDSLLVNGWFSAAPNDVSVNRAIRTNNPGALNISKWQKSRPGYIGITPADSNGNRTTIYRTPEHGVGAWYHLLAVVYGFGVTGRFALAELASLYAGGNTKAAKTYIKGWGLWSGGLLKDDTVTHLNDDNELLTLAKAMFAHEAAQRSPLHDEQITWAIDQERAGALPEIDEATRSYARKLNESDFEELREQGNQFGINPEPIEQLIIFQSKERPYTRLRYWAILDFTMRSDQRRLYVIDVVERGVDRYYCSHGKGSEGRDNDGYATVFSNRAGSNASSLGIYTCAEPYYGENGYSLRLDGEESTNSNARSRAIVVHGADYVSEKWLRRHSYLGRSRGCPAIDHAYASQIVDELKHGSLLNAWAA
ncbi:hypothetical protein GFL63_20970 [Rhizobium leguminosarum bv. viciae]|uniref:murein L,D-transpeptidase catalytic domain-containing protein n=1 Tax=Rhizobium leguminosarum TaxID=384 RepID=UPI001442127C|nr:murein L,D-transpeptidase catalytic domain family protein [Rhizobium leguminosarum]NKK01228.1 hypothetical protein [Rhizobium leguminosarum bv. viciae]